MRVGIPSGGKSGRTARVAAFDAPRIAIDGERGSDSRIIGDEFPDQNSRHHLQL